MELDYNQYRQIAEHLPNLVWRSTADGTCEYFNPNWICFTGRTLDEEMGDGWLQSIQPDDVSRVLAIFANARKLRQAFDTVFRMKRHDGEWRWIAGRGMPFFDGLESLGGYIGSFLDVTEMVVGEQLREMAQKDGLTGINSRQYFEQLAHAELEKAKRYRADLCVVMVDINHFKAINDTYGHLTGDNVLRAFSKILHATARDLDLVGRYGGDEFVILLPNTGTDNAAAFMNRLEKAMEMPFVLDNVKLHIGISYGITGMEWNDSLETMLLRSDIKMYLMKNEKYRLDLADAL